MYKISQLAERAGISRTTLLYYEKLGIIKGARQANGYRSYSDKDLQRLLLLQKIAGWWFDAERVSGLFRRTNQS